MRFGKYCDVANGPIMHVRSEERYTCHTMPMINVKAQAALCPKACSIVYRNTFTKFSSPEPTRKNKYNFLIFNEPSYKTRSFLKIFPHEKSLSCLTTEARQGFSASLQRQERGRGFPYRLNYLPESIVRYPDRYLGEDSSFSSYIPNTSYAHHTEKEAI
ncbi:hypothetical protein TNCT_476541 [Trichonephila clavata]|uniref:Uncharacterized protein n=1 Tax=Trichonephila clavata TaxID=2740835 RepID=A0A8X6GTH8_TRICU|nr:hypothetical protein TNCT_476541 [Trichonephila clavata]